MWTPRQWPGSEHLALRMSGDGITADGIVLAALDEGLTRLAYRIECDRAWATRSVVIDLHGHARRILTRDERGRWFENGGERADLDGCVDVDIALTPFSNTLPIRRLGLAPGDAADLRMVYIEPVPEPNIAPTEQRYTRLESGYRFESEGFRADLPVDEDGLVTDYPGLWTME
ncbi:putative glycolipid-binding domain-containing protein [Glycomyces tarimensis]